MRKILLAVVLALVLVTPALAAKPVGTYQTLPSASYGSLLLNTATGELKEYSSNKTWIKVSGPLAANGTAVGRYELVAMPYEFGPGTADNPGTSAVTVTFVLVCDTTTGQVWLVEPGSPPKIKAFSPPLP